MEGESRRGPPALDAGRTKGSLRTSAKCRKGVGGELVKEVEVVEREAAGVELTERLCVMSCERRLPKKKTAAVARVWAARNLAGVWAAPKIQPRTPPLLCCCIILQKLSTILASKEDIERLISVGSDLAVRTLLLNYIVFGG
jgi:hypothetical protein